MVPFNILCNNFNSFYGTLIINIFMLQIYTLYTDISKMMKNSTFISILQMTKLKFLLVKYTWTPKGCKSGWEPFQDIIPCSLPPFHLPSFALYNNSGWPVWGVVFPFAEEKRKLHAVYLELDPNYNELTNTTGPLTSVMMFYVLSIKILIQWIGSWMNKPVKV